MAIPPFPPQFDLQVQHAKVEGQLHVIESENVHGQLNVAGVAHLENAVRIDGALTVGNDADFAGRVTTTEVRLAFSGVDATLWPLLRATGANQAEVGGALRVTGVTTLGNDAQVAGNLTVTGILDAAAIHQNGQPFVGSNWDKVAGGINYSGGKVGIGVANPTQALEVNGAIKATDFIKGATPLISSQWTGVSTGISYSDGSVAIGIAAPQAKLHIEAGSIFVNGEGTGVIVDESGRKRVGFMKYIGREGGIWRLNTQNFEIGRLDASVTALPGNPTTFTTDLYIAGNGNVGIGTASPSQTLEVNGAVMATDFIKGAAALVSSQWTDVAGGINYPSGRVGIGTTTPSGNLQIAGPRPELFLGGNTTANQDGLRIHYNETAGVRAGVIDVKGASLRLRGESGAGGAGATERLLIDLTTGHVGIGTTNPGAPLHVANYMAVGPFAATTGQGGIDVTGPAAEFGFVKRSLSSWPANPAPGDRFVWYNPDGTARLWTDNRGDLLTVTNDGNLGIGTPTPGFRLDVAERMRVRQGGSGSAGIWFFQNGPNADRAFVGMANDTGVGFWGNTGAGWGLVMNTGNGNVGVGNANPGVKLHVIGNRIRLSSPANSNQYLDMRADGSALDLESSTDLYLNNNGVQIYYRKLNPVSSRDLKEEIRELSHDEASQLLQRLTPVHFRYKDDVTKEQLLGFIAEDVPTIIATPDRKGVVPMNVIAVLCGALQDQQKKIVILQENIQRLQHLLTGSRSTPSLKVITNNEHTGVEFKKDIPFW